MFLTNKTLSPVHALEFAIGIEIAQLDEENKQDEIIFI